MVLLFVPFGVAAIMLSKNLTRRGLFFGSVTAILLIEVSQYLSERGSMDIDDLLLNLLGVGIGYLIYPVVEKVVKVNKK